MENKRLTDLESHVTITLNGESREIVPFFFIETEEDGIISVPNPEYIAFITLEKYKIRLQKYSKIPKDYWNLEFDNYKGNLSTASKDNAVAYTENFDTPKFEAVNLYLFGNHSCQKTMIACNIGKGLLKKGYDVKFVYASELIDLLMKSQGYGTLPEVEEEIKKYHEADLLIIDDIFDFEKSTYWEKSSHIIIGCWDKFLRRRISENKRIVVTSNYSVSALEEKFGVSIFNLIKRNFYELTFYDNVNDVCQSKFANLFD